MNASWPQTKTIWGICIKVKSKTYAGKATDSLFWKEQADKGLLTREKASAIIGAFISKDVTTFTRGVAEFDQPWVTDVPAFVAARRWKPRKNYPPPRPIRSSPPPTIEDEEQEEQEQEEVPPVIAIEGEDEFSVKLRELEAAHKKAQEEARKRKERESFKTESIEYVKPDIFDDVCTMIKGGVQVCLVGPSGCGKSLMINEISKVLGRGLYVESFAGGKRYSQVFGSTHLVDGKSEWVQAKFMQELQKDNMIIFMDEVMSADPDVLIGANPILDRKTRCFHSPVGVIAVNPTCTICAASNVTGREYSMNYKGTQQQDASVLNRFVHVHMSYDDRVETTIVKKSPIDTADRKYLLDHLKDLRQKVSANNIAYDPSTRKLVQAIELNVLGLPIQKAFEYSFLTPLSPVERRKLAC